MMNRVPKGASLLGALTLSLSLSISLGLAAAQPARAARVGLPTQGELVDQQEGSMDAHGRSTRVETRRFPGRTHPLSRFEERTVYDAATGETRVLERREYVADHLIARFGSPLTPQESAELERACSPYPIRIERLPSRREFIYRISFDGTRIRSQNDLLEKLRSFPTVLRVDRDGVVHGQ